MVLKSDNVAALTLWDSGGAGLGKFHNNLTIIGKATSAATVTGDGSTTLTTKGYVDGLVTGAATYQGVGTLELLPKAVVGTEVIQI